MTKMKLTFEHCLSAHAQKIFSRCQAYIIDKGKKAFVKYIILGTNMLRNRNSDLNVCIFDYVESVLLKKINLNFVNCQQNEMTFAL